MLITSKIVFTLTNYWRALQVKCKKISRPSAPRIGNRLTNRGEKAGRVTQFSPKLPSRALMLISVDALSQHANTCRTPHVHLGSHAQEHSVFDNADRIVQLRGFRLDGGAFFKRAI